jgi:hypothetical protein
MTIKDLNGFSCEDDKGNFYLSKDGVTWENPYISNQNLTPLTEMQLIEFRKIYHDLFETMNTYPMEERCRLIFLKGIETAKTVKEVDSFD